MAPQQMEVDVADALRAMRAKAPADLQDFFARFEDLHDRKYVPSTPSPLIIARLWHQLTVKLQEFTAKPQSAPFLVQLYEKFIAAFEAKLNKTLFVQLMLVTSRQFTGAPV